jgi:sterol desaturase/sphingolipid hydroxylase (fatty acid hydroxylase superfamily)
MDELKVSRAYRILVDLRVISAFYCSVIAYAITQVMFTGLLSSLGYLVAGFLTVNFWEYAIHRWLFHPTPWGNQYKQWILRIHARHHRFVGKSLYSVAPISTSFAVILVSLGIQSVLDPSTNALWCYFIALCLSYLYHEFVHHWVHHIQSSNWIHRRYVVFHDGHHTESSKQNFGFISPFWDVVFRTFTNK